MDIFTPPHCVLVVSWLFVVALSLLLLLHLEKLFLIGSSSQEVKCLPEIAMSKYQYRLLWLMTAAVSQPD